MYQIEPYHIHIILPHINIGDFINEANSTFFNYTIKYFW